MNVNVALVSIDEWSNRGTMIHLQTWFNSIERSKIHSPRDPPKPSHFSPFLSTMMIHHTNALFVALVALWTSSTVNSWVVVPVSSTGIAARPSSTRPPTTTTALEMVDMANGQMSFDRVCREWRCKYTGDKTDSKSLEAIAAVVDEYIGQIKSASADITVNRLVCGACLDFKLMMTVPLSDFGPWEAKGFAPESEFLRKIAAIPGVSQVETQTITNMVI
jgi:hypothetical protein